MASSSSSSSSSTASLSSSSRNFNRGLFSVALFLFILLTGTDLGRAATPYVGKKIGSFKTYHHGVVGDVYAVDSKTIHIKGFAYDGQGPDAFFWAGTSPKPNSEGFIVPDEKGTKNVLQSYNNRDLTLTLPEGKTLRDIKWLSVWCRSFAANFADVFIPVDFDAPRPQRLEAIRGVMHNTSSGPIVIVDAQTFMVPNFYTDGQAPDAHFWVGRGPKPTADGILVPDENGSAKPLGRYDGQSLVIQMPGALTVFDVDWLSVWCREFAVDFGHVKIPKNLNVPPSLKMLGVSPQSKLNCEVLSDDLGFEVRWARAGDTIVVQLVARLANGEYMSFGLSGDSQRSQMIGGDVIVAWVDAVGNGHAIDYFLDDKAQCAGGRGSCPDRRIQPNTNTVRLLNAAVINGYSMITYQRPLIAVDRWDRPIRRNGSQPIIWAVGPLNSEAEASYHTQRNKADMYIDFGRTPSWNCPAPLSEPPQPPSRPSSHHPVGQGSHPNRASAVRPTHKQSDPTPSSSVPSSSRQPADDSSRPKKPQEGSGPQSSSRPATSPSSSSSSAATPQPVAPSSEAWFIPPIECPEPQDNVFYAQIGPAGGKKGYTSITGHVGWGIAWYINGLLIPEITVVRGKTYTFVVEGGNDPETSARNHPFYITDDPVGGLGTKSLAEQEKVRVYAGVRFNADGEPESSAAGRLCEWVQRSKEAAEEYGSFGEYQRVLELSCDKGQAAVLQWTPDADTPDLVYYQCYTHRYLGWKIHVVDQCEFDHDFGSSFVHELNASRSVTKRQQNEETVASDENSGRSFPNTKLVRVGGSMSSVGAAIKIGMEDNPGPLSASSPTIITHPDENRNESFFVKDPFVSNESVPFQAGFRPGEPQFGGFGASDFGQRFEKMSPMRLNKQVVPAIRTSVLPSRLGSVYQPNDRRHIKVISGSAGSGGGGGDNVQRQPPQHPPVVFVPEGHDPRVPAAADATVRRRIRPFRPERPNHNNRPPIAVPVRGESAIEQQQRPVHPNEHPRRQFIVQSGGDIVLPPKKAMPADDPILTNVWSIINNEKNRVRGTRRARQTVEEEGESDMPADASESEMPSETKDSSPMMTPVTTMTPKKKLGSGSMSALNEITFRNYVLLGMLLVTGLLSNVINFIAV